MTRRPWRRPLHFLVAWVATTVLVALCAFVLWSHRQEGTHLSEVTLRNTAMLLAARVENEFDQADALLRSVSYRYAHVTRPGAEELARLTDEVRNDVAVHPFIKRVGIIDGEGINFFSTATALAQALETDLAAGAPHPEAGFDPLAAATRLNEELSRVASAIDLELNR
ncbi:MAG: hypothetical protein RLZZ584_2401 [Pseudomonadota bacterium]